MEENFKSKLGFIFFILIVLFLAIGGYFFMDYTLNNKETNNEEEDQVISYKIDDSKDYIYYINESTISEGAQIYYKDVVINLNTQTTLTESLAKENERYKNNVQKISETDLISDELINYRNDDIYALTFRNYENYEFGKYVSLVIYDYNYSCFDSITFKEFKSYVFDSSTGKRVENDELLKMYNLNMDNIKEKVRTDLESKQGNNEEGTANINIDETLNNIEESQFYINNFGRLCVCYLAKTAEGSYNEVMEVS